MAFKIGKSSSSNPYYSWSAGITELGCWIAVQSLKISFVLHMFIHLSL